MDNLRLHYLLVMKGAPERIIEKCSTIYIDGQDIEMNDCKIFILKKKKRIFLF